MAKPKITRDGYHAQYANVTGPYKVNCPVSMREWWVLPGVLDPTKSYASKIFARVAYKCPHYPGKVLVVGSGCGIDAVIAAEKNKLVHAVDINPRAVVNTQINAEMHRAKNMKIYWSDCFSEVTDTDFDFIYFNHPFVFPEKPEGKCETVRSGIDWAICDKDYRLLARFMRQAPKHLVRPGGGGLGGGIIVSTSTVNRGIDVFHQYVQDYGYHEAMVLEKTEKDGEEFFVFGTSPTWRKKSGRRKSR